MFHNCPVNTKHLYNICTALTFVQHCRPTNFIQNVLFVGWGI